MKIATVSIVCITLAASAVGCGAANDVQPVSDDPSELLTSTVSVKQADGTYKRRTYTVTRAERNAAAAARVARQSTHREGAQPLIADIGPENCENGAALWLYRWQNPPDWNAPQCCVVGGGSDFITNLCGFDVIYSLWIGESGGNYGNSAEGCGDSFDSWGPPLTGGKITPIDCRIPNADWVQLDF